MKLQDCTYGKLVTFKRDSFALGVSEVGMIVGITNNVPSADLTTRSKIDHAVPLVQWSNGEVLSVHHNNIEIYKD